MQGGDEVDLHADDTIDEALTEISNKNNNNTIVDETSMAVPTEGDGGVVSGTNVAATVDESKKSERKRKRERQRRSDLANAFEELSTLVIQIDPEDNINDPQSTTTTLTDIDGMAVPSSALAPSASMREHAGGGGGASSSGSNTRRGAHRRKSSMGETDAAAAAELDGSGMTRLDLIGRTTMLLRRLQRENMDLRRRLDEYKKGRTTGGGNSDGNMMGMGGHHHDDMVCSLEMYQMYYSNRIRYADSVLTPVRCFVFLSVSLL